MLSDTTTFLAQGPRGARSFEFRHPVRRAAAKSDATAAGCGRCRRCRKQQTVSRSAQPSPTARAASAALAVYIVGASDWLRSICQDRATFSDKPALVLWGLKDVAFRRKELEQWKWSLRHAEVQEFEDYGQFLGEEAPDRVMKALRIVMRRS